MTCYFVLRYTDKTAGFQSYVWHRKIKTDMLRYTALLMGRCIDFFALL